MVLKKMNILLITAFLIGCCVCACGKEDSITSETLEKDTEEVSSTEETKVQRKRLQNSGKRATIFPWTNRKRWKLKMTV